MSQLLKESMINALKPFLKKHKFNKTRTTWHRVEENSISVFNIQGSQWGDDYYINLGVYLRALGAELTPPVNLCHMQRRLIYENKHVDEIVDEAMSWFEIHGNISTLKELYKENKLPPVTFVKVKEYLSSDLG